MLKQTEFDKSISQELDHAEKTLRTWLKDIQNMTVKEVMAAHDKAFVSSVQYILSLDVEPSVRAEHLQEFLELLTERLASEVSTQMFKDQMK